MAIKVLQTDKLMKPQVRVHRVHFIRRWGWAAAIFLIGTTIGVSVLINQKQLTPKPDFVKQGATTDILPGSNKAVLTLSDGTTIILDHAADGTIAKQGNSSVIKLNNGEIRYNASGPVQGKVMMNTMSTPRGGQYNLVLPDGSKAWLNAASSVTYPAFFIDGDRKIKITGEVYLEIAKDKTKPFLVDVDGHSTVQVLGTSFNINSYADDGNIKTTLVAGKVKVTGGTGNYSPVVLRPGEQALQENGTAKISVKPGIDINQVLAWKNGIFNFNNSDIRSVMKQLERWYDIDVKFDGKIPDFRFNGEMDRGVMLSTVQRFLSDYGIKTKLDGKTLTIEGK